MAKNKNKSYLVKTSQAPAPKKDKYVWVQSSVCNGYIIGVLDDNGVVYRNEEFELVKDAVAFIKTLEIVD